MKISNSIQITDYSDIIESAIEPSSPTENMLWKDTSLGLGILKEYLNGSWIEKQTHAIATEFNTSTTEISHVIQDAGLLGSGFIDGFITIFTTENDPLSEIDNSTIRPFDVWRRSPDKVTVGELELYSDAMVTYNEGDFIYFYIDRTSNWQFCNAQQISLLKSITKYIEGISIEDGKIRLFAATPVTPYDLGDLWLSGDLIYECVNQKTSLELFINSDWRVHTETNLTPIIDNLMQTLDVVMNQIDGKLECWFLDGAPTLVNEPANAWTTSQLKLEHKFDQYYDKLTDKSYSWTGKNWREIFTTSISASLKIANGDESTLDGLLTIFNESGGNPDGYSKGDLWYSGNVTKVAIADMITSYKSTDWISQADDTVNKLGTNEDILTGGWLYPEGTTSGFRTSNPEDALVTNYVAMNSNGLEALSKVGESWYTNFFINNSDQSYNKYYDSGKFYSVAPGDVFVAGTIMAKSGIFSNTISFSETGTSIADEFTTANENADGTKVTVPLSAGGTTTLIDGNSIRTGLVTADRITVGGVTSQLAAPINFGDITGVAEARAEARTIIRTLGEIK